MLRLMLGAGRADAGLDTIDHAVGVVLRLKVGDRVEIGTALGDVHAANSEHDPSVRAAVERLIAAFHITPEPPAFRPLILSVVTAEGTERYNS